jgi:hypothetical protein
MVSVKNYEGLYSVTGDGKIYSHIKNRFLRPGLGKDGYLVVVLVKDKTPKSYRLHRLIAKAYILNPQNLPEINHLDGNKTNNCIDNLQWVTGAQNVQHAYQNGLMARDTIRKITLAQARQIRGLYQNGQYTTRKLARLFSVDAASVSRIITNKAYKELPHKAS